MKSVYNVLKLPLAFLALLLHVIGFASTYLIALRWWYWVTHALHGFLSNLASLSALFWALSSTSYSQLIVLVYLLNTPSSLAYQNPAWLHCNLSLMRLLV